MELQLNYCPLIWMYCGRSTNNNIKKFDERALRIVYDEYNSKFKELLTKDGSITIHHENIQTLTMQMFKIHNGFLQISFLDLYHNCNENYFCSLRC